MRKFKQDISFLLIIFLIPLIILSCNNQDVGNKNNATAENDTAASIKENKPGTGKNLIGDNLYVIYIDRQTFLTNTQGVGRMLLSHVATSGDSLTLHGWRIQGNNFGAPIIQFLPGIASGLTYQTGWYLNNVIIRQNVLTSVRNNLNSDPTLAYVAFVPLDSSNYVKYRIYTTNQDPRTSIPIPDALQLDLEANPSPPKNY